MKKRNMANAIMVALIVGIAAVGIGVAGMVLGWFDKTEDAVLATQVKGVVTMQRDGLAFPLEEDGIALHDGDRLQTAKGATVMLMSGQDYLVLNENTAVQVERCEPMTLQLLSGEAFAVAQQGEIQLLLEHGTVTLNDTAAAASAFSGAQTLMVFANAAQAADARVEAGQQLRWINGEAEEPSAFQAQALNAFCISQAQQANRQMQLCFSKAQLEKVLSDRAEALQQMIQNQTTLPTAPTATQPTQSQTEPSQEEPSPSTEPAGTEPSEPSVATEPSPVPTEPEKPTQPDTGLYCTITIRCDTVLQNYSALKPDKAGCVPSDGVILPVVQVSFAEGESVLDVLKRVCAQTGIQLEYSWTPMYNSGYVEGINNLYEFDCGSQSGWMFSVNGWFPNYGCSAYQIQPGDAIVWAYTCKGLGEDLGAGMG